MRSSFNAVALFAVSAFGSANAFEDAAYSQGAEGTVPKSSGQYYSQFQKKALVCNADNALRALRATQRAAVATPFCQNYLGIPTSTITATVTPTTLVSSTAVVTQTELYTEYVHETRVHTVVIDQTSTVTVTETVTVPYQVAKRTEVAVPDFMQPFPASRISSACSCLGVPTPSTTVTATAVPVTNYDISTSVTVVSEPTTVTIETSVTTEVSILQIDHIQSLRAHVLIPAQETKVATVTATEQVSVTATPPADAEFYIKSTAGEAVGQYLTPFARSNDDRQIIFTTDKTIATKFKLGADGVLTFADSIRHNPPVEVRSFLNTNRESQSVFFSSTVALPGCVRGGGCYYITFAINANKVLVSTNSNGVAQDRICPVATGGRQWFLAKPAAAISNCQLLTLSVEYI
ncbi:hypothetical protein HJFPF1_07138 [Paramyrothecium foliicola]|nr:hypothetical protein HJFPF1_07138 [Paramyrothecium foliicola]